MRKSIVKKNEITLKEALMIAFADLMGELESFDSSYEKNLAVDYEMSAIVINSIQKRIQKRKKAHLDG